MASANPIITTTDFATAEDLKFCNFTLYLTLA